MYHVVVNVLSIDQSLEEMTLGLKNDCLHGTTIFRWYRESQRSNFTLEDAERKGRPRTSVTEENHYCCEENA
ncbi:unnamed protein product [Acanthoscelides obtectus]|uniref:Mos1 transposase HTH domain-containing protein n=1 Tax=Acanthoscelides obtectus TaxID=200917 RepID=A0A9P0Q3Q2_ACAOB|nr:unnamed protein product [Acanthoscelides obtectus]CAH2014560.1 unnamed protein product [Acanthoscelides obtectus]CAK1625362.1 hypothetical protein AOBTE_LOCUS3126 [Acanthoscelides obtectus]CAK1625383.1 hypothetical protein AOBTE_LOCUS3136 [Acanthoscelides obtectus]